VILHFFIGLIASVKLSSFKFILFTLDEHMHILLYLLASVSQPRISLARLDEHMHLFFSRVVDSIGIILCNIFANSDWLATTVNRANRRCFVSSQFTYLHVYDLQI
jgi:hypothetical protein